MQLFGKCVAGESKVRCSSWFSSTSKAQQRENTKEQSRYTLADFLVFPCSTWIKTTDSLVFLLGPQTEKDCACTVYFPSQPSACRKIFGPTPSTRSLRMNLSKRLNCRRNVRNLIDNATVLKWDPLSLWISFRFWHQFHSVIVEIDRYRLGSITRTNEKSVLRTKLAPSKMQCQSK